MWTGTINTQIFDEKLLEMDKESRSHLFWLARNNQLYAKSRPQTARASTDRSLSQGSWTNLSVMFTRPSADASRQADDRSSVTSTSSKIRNFCYLCSTIDEHQRCHLYRARALASQDGSVRKKRQCVRYVPPTPRTRKRVEETAPVVQEAFYKVTVWTGDVPQASTDANVYITVEGDEGVLPKTRLWRRHGANCFTFVRGSREVFHIKGPRLGNLRTITVEHDGLEKKHGWYLEKVEVQCLLTRRVWQFSCSDWLSVHHTDSTTRRDLQAALKEQAVREYEVTVDTGKKHFAGTDANVYITLHGTEGSTCRLLLNAQHPPGTCFQRGHSDRFKIQVPYVGELRSLRIEHDGSGAASSWYLTKVTVHDMHEPQSVYHFVHNGWLAKDMGDGRLWRELRALNQLPINGTSRKPVQYEVVVKTGDIHGAGTTANVYVFLTGTTGKTRKIFLSDSTSNFERSKTESFRLKAQDVGQVTSIRIGVDTSGPESGWFCDHIKVRKALSRYEICEKLKQLKHEWRAAKQREQKEMDNASSHQMTENTTDSTDAAKNGKVDAETLPTSPTNQPSSETPGETSLSNQITSETAQTPRPKSTGEGERGTELAKVFDGSGRVVRIPVSEEYFFPCSKWFASEQGSDDRLFERELPVEWQKLYYQEREIIAVQQ